MRGLVRAVAERCPGGGVSRRDGAADPARTTTAFRRKAAALGATVREGVAATNIRKEDGLWRVAVGADAQAAAVPPNSPGGGARRIAAGPGQPVHREARAHRPQRPSRLPAG